MKYAIGWVLLSALIVTVLGSHGWLDYRRLIARGVETKGTVVDLYPKNHRHVRYRYEVAGNSFQGIMSSWPPNPPMEQLSPGNDVVVYYDPERPHISALGDPKPIFDNETIYILIGALIFPSLIVGRWIFRDYRAKKPKANAASKSALQAG